MRNKFIKMGLFVLIQMVMPPATVLGQGWSVSSNVISLADYGTFNAEASYGVSKHWSLIAGVKYNPFQYGDEDVSVMRKRQRAFNLGARYWPWHIYSGWWLSSGARFQEYNFSKKRNLDTSEGDRLGASVSAGYSYMLSPRMNIEVGIGFWGGWDKYKVYACPTCGYTKESGSKFFLSPEDVILAFSIIF